MSATPRQPLPPRAILPDRTKFLPVVAGAIPHAMQNLNHWLFWKSAPGKNGRPTKKPYQIGKPEIASSTDPNTWNSFAEAVCSGTLNDYDGLGFAFQDSGIVFIDFDHVRNPTGEIAAWAAEIITALGSYAEISPSGTGVHVYVLGKLPGKGLSRKFSDGSALEMYDKGRYGTVTGNLVTGDLEELHPADVASLYQRLKNGDLGPDTGELITEERAEASEESETASNAGTVLQLLEKFGLTITSTENHYQGETELGVKYVLDACPFNPEHRDAAVFAYPSGPVFSCFHDSCKGKGNNWQALCRKFNFQALILGENGKPKSLLINAVLMLRQAPEWHGVLGFNEFSLYTVARRAAPWLQSQAGQNWTDDDDSHAACWLQQHGLSVSSKVAAEAVQTVAKEYPFHPVREYLAGLAWDGKERIDMWLCAYLGVEDSPYTRAIASRWLISACARIYQPGCQADAVLLLEGLQGTLKSSALRTLAGDEWFSDCVSELGSKDSRLELHGNWIVEIPECDRIKRGDLERVKGFLSTRFDKFRPPYGRHTETFPRTCVSRVQAMMKLLLLIPQGIADFGRCAAFGLILKL